MTRSLLAVLCIALVSGGCSKSGPSEPSPTPDGIPEVESNDVTPQALGTLGTGDIRVNGTCGGSDVDWYSIAVTSATNFHVSVDWGSGDLDLGIADGNGIMLTFRDTGGKPERCTLTALSPGTYRVRVTAKGGPVVPYVLTIGPR